MSSLVLPPQYLPIIESSIRYIMHEYERQYFNFYQKELSFYEAPINNSGVTLTFDNFSISAYNWNDEEDHAPNFHYDKLSFYWYKYLGRGNYATFSDNTFDVNFLAKMIEDCFAGIDRYFRSLPGYEPDYYEEIEKEFAK